MAFDESQHRSLRKSRRERAPFAPRLLAFGNYIPCRCISRHGQLRRIVRLEIDDDDFHRIDDRLRVKRIERELCMLARVSDYEKRSKLRA